MREPVKNKILILGFGSQGSAWAQCLRQSGWKVHVYLSQMGPSFQKAKEQGFDPQSIELLPQALSDLTETHWIAMLCPDPAISLVYQKYISNCQGNVRLILAHGYALYAGELQMASPTHQPLLLAPKAIGPKILQHFKASFPEPHSLIAAFSTNSLGSSCHTLSEGPECPEYPEYPEYNDEKALTQIARGLGFAQESLVRVTFDEETMGDLISEQGLLCGGIFTLLEWTLEAMSAAGIPERLIREECFSELELIAGMIRDRGPSQTLQCISQVAQSGTIAMASRFERSGLKELFLEQVEEIKNRQFARYFKSQLWTDSSQKLAKRLETFEKKLETKGV